MPNSYTLSCPSGPAIVGNGSANDACARLPNYHTPVLTKATTWPLMGLTGLLNRVAVVEKLQTTQIVAEAGTGCLPERSPPPISGSDVTRCWRALPSMHRQRLVRRLRHRLARQLLASGASREDGHDAARADCGVALARCENPPPAPEATGGRVGAAIDAATGAGASGIDPAARQPGTSEHLEQEG